MFLGAVNSIWQLFKDLVSSVLDIDWIFYIAGGFFLLTTIFFFVRVRSAYEYKLNKTAERLNEWLVSHQTITQENLIQFNNIIKDKRSPKILRKYWQQYMLYRDKAPSEYMSSYNCIDKPLKTSRATTSIKYYTMIYKITALVSLVFSMLTFSSIGAEIVSKSWIIYLTKSAIAPLLILFLGTIFAIGLRAMQNYNIASLYQTFNMFNRCIDKASISIPDYVDFEILFTKQEIHEGIPILGEYLEKRARQEQEELEEKRRNEVAHEVYDFSESGVDGSLVIERAMKESETYINVKQRLLSEIQQFESEISSLKKNYENTSKDYQRKLQASKENMERLRQQQEESTNRIAVNYIRKQQQDEVKKQEQLEKDQESATNKFNSEVKSLNEEIEKRRQDLEEKRVKVQEAMQSEYQTFSEKLFKQISSEVETDKDTVVSAISEEKEQYAQAIAYLKNEIDNKDRIIAELQQRLANGSTDGTFLGTEAVTPVQEQEEPELNFDINVEQEQPQEEPQAQEQEELEGHYDDKGYYWFNNGSYYDANNLYHDLEGNVYDADGNLLESNQVVETENQIQTLEIPQEEAPEANLTEETQIIKDSFSSEAESVENTTEPQVEEPQVQEQEELEGHYDDKGYYWFDNGSYYDTQNLFHDIDGNVYDADGNLLESNQVVETENATDEEPQVEEIPNIEEDVQEEDVQEEVQEEFTQAQAEPRRVGRPKKEVSEEEANKPKRSVGRPKKQVSDEDENKTKRRAGRPKKEVSEEEANKPKRSVGRPKKN